VGGLIVAMIRINKAAPSLGRWCEKINLKSRKDVK